MKYCSFCGCYIPDNWDNCPACGKRNYTPELIIHYNNPIDTDVNKTLYGRSDLAQAITTSKIIKTRLLMQQWIVWQKDWNCLMVIDGGEKYEICMF